MLLAQMSSLPSHFKFFIKSCHFEHTLEVTMNSGKHGNLVLTSVTSLQIENWLDLHTKGVCMRVCILQYLSGTNSKLQ